ncbi:YrhK family protein [Paenibacillus sp. F411]|uniref:YrhK domain-containing protein n=1 Tax=Paenibacillus algicola TaxID=2565926 RepID=A0A4P8XGL5_9BACL|nr:MULTISPECIES: YrhK family protein [Paenibacillus]MBO2945661.1 YrhK family protein [Paenibacillus sp. F411]QCT01455.1 hypothetical protein E6C60_0734 [Paenibacillus algicola]
MQQDNKLNPRGAGSHSADAHHIPPMRARMKRRLAEAARRKRRITVTNRYETGMVLSEIVTGFFFIAGSISMFYTDTDIPVVLYLVGSIMMLLRSGLRVSYWFRLKELQQKGHDEGAPNGAGWSR